MAPYYSIDDPTKSSHRAEIDISDLQTKYDKLESQIDNLYRLIEKIIENQGSNANNSRCKVSDCYNIIYHNITH